MNRVVITGLGIYSCIGRDLEEVKNSLFQGKSGIIYDASRKQMGFRSALTGFVERPNLKGLLDRRARIMLPEQGEYAYMATLQALAQAGLDPEYIHSKEIGILYGNDSSAKSTIEAVDIMRQKRHHAGWLRRRFSDDEFNRHDEPGNHIQAPGHQFYHQRGLCQRVPCDRSWISFHQNGASGMRHNRRSTGNQCLIDGKF